jgi:acetyl-CoA carboxylase carboxyl transferase subunit alpha
LTRAPPPEITAVSNEYMLPFEKPIHDLETKLRELKTASEGQDIDVSIEIERMEQKVAQTRQKIYGNLSAWQKVQVARHPRRPYTRDYIKLMATEFAELHGDRLFRDDKAVVGGFATLSGRRVMLIGTQKGRDTKAKLDCNFGSPFPEGYRKALRLMRLANRFRLPIICLIDTPGAFPGIESEERHVAEAIAVNLRESFTFSVPILAVITGEGGSGGALGIGVANRILVLENAYYSVITPEGCAAILWKDRAFADRAAEALKLTAQDLLEAGLSDGVVPEPEGGAHKDPAAMAATLKSAILTHLDELLAQSPEQLRDDRYAKFRAMGRFQEDQVPAPKGTAEPTERAEHAESAEPAGTATEA